jgi:hypothetical protein
MTDCQDGSDELNCTFGMAGNVSSLSASALSSAWCDVDQWACRTINETWCINTTQLCDRRADCPDGSDEANCTYECSSHEFECAAAASVRHRTNETSSQEETHAGDGRCVAASKRCDGIADCFDGSDETGCDAEFGRAQTTSMPATCPPHFFRCHNGTRIGVRRSFVSSSMACVPERLRCDRRPDCTDLSDEFNCTYSCPAGHVTCSSGALSRWPWRGFCLPSQRRCDGRRDCADGSDETGCRTDSGVAASMLLRCASGQFRCRNGSVTVFGSRASRVCISGRLQCDGIRDCSDGSDEMSCDYSSFCLPDQFACRSTSAVAAAAADRFLPRIRRRDRSFCLDASMRCDGIVHCADASDETGCDVAHATTTAETVACNGDFRCASDSRCIPRRWTCDRELDCADGSDEVNCSYSCQDGQFACRTGTVSRWPNFGYCVQPSGRCDGIADCRDESDEQNCSADRTAVVRHQSSVRRCQLPTDFQCRTASGSASGDDDECVPANFRCDRVADCTSAADETGCSYLCPDQWIACRTGVVSGWPHRGYCIRRSSRCDGVRDCLDGSDEADCTECSPGNQDVDPTRALLMSFLQLHSSSHGMHFYNFRSCSTANF